MKPNSAEGGIFCIFPFFFFLELRDDDDDEETEFTDEEVESKVPLELLDFFYQEKRLKIILFYSWHGFYKGVFLFYKERV